MRSAVALALCLLTSVALADWGKARYVRLPDDRMVIFAGSQRFVLKQDVAWTLDPSTPRKLFQQWRKSAQLPEDLGQLVQNAPPDAGLPLLGEIAKGEGDTFVCALKGQKPLEIPMSKVAGGLEPVDKGAAFTDFSKALKVQPSTILIGLSGLGGGGISEAKAWSTAAKRLSGKEVFIPVDGSTGILWAHRNLSAAALKDGQAAVKKTLKVEQKPAKKEEKGGIDFVLVGGIVVGLAAIGSGVYFFLKGQGGRKTVAVTRLTEAERDLLQRVRADPQPEQAVVNKMIEAYDRYDRVKKERDELQSYRKFEQDFRQFQARYEGAVADANMKEASLKTAHDQMRGQAEQMRALQTELQRANNENQGLSSTLQEANRLLEDFEGWCSGLDSKVRAMAAETEHE
ncbi:MAG TPA: hypothetical protein VG944_16600 [Fimbriimonas sp.]|nr:hypothetical protein [Fimbriimonas sp.]